MSNSGIQKRKVVYVISLVYKSAVFEQTAWDLCTSFDLTIILLNPAPSALENFLVKHDIGVKRIKFSGKRDFFMASIKFFFYLLFHRPYAVHAHLFDAQLIGLSISWLLRIKKRIYTRHSSNYHHVYHPQGVKYDRLSNFLATHIVSISQATDYTLASNEGVNKSKIIRVPHGFDLSTFSAVSFDRVEKVKFKWNIQGAPVIGVIARHIEWKGIQYIIPAFKQFIETNPQAVLVLANATGPYTGTLKEMLHTIPEGNVVLIPFEEDIGALYKCFGLYVHTPVDELCEAFGQTYVEALAAGIPSIFTLSGIAKEFIEHNQNAFVAKFRNSASILTGMIKIINDQTYRLRLIENGKRAVSPRFDRKPVKEKLEQLYNS